MWILWPSCLVGIYLRLVISPVLIQLTPLSITYFCIYSEPSAALDAVGETAVADAMMACRVANRALLLITHQAKRLREVDTILVLQHGEIAERGTYEELSHNTDSVLRRLYPDLIRQ